MPRSETITFYKARKEGLASTRMGHIEKEYSIESDLSSEDGTRTIILKPKDLSKIDSMRKEIVDSLMGKLGETSKTLKAILKDTLRDYGDASLKRLYRKVVLGQETIRKGPGCFYISVGDGRKKSSDIIRVRS